MSAPFFNTKQDSISLKGIGAKWKEALLTGTETIASCYTRSGRCRHETLYIPAKGSRAVPGRLYLFCTIREADEKRV
jgi:hypothetical protein